MEMVVDSLELIPQISTITFNTGRTMENNLIAAEILERMKYTYLLPINS